MQIPRDIGTIHILGIGGIGMSAIAEILHAKGFRVQGTDQKDGANLGRLRAKGIPVFVGHSEAVNIEFEDGITAQEAREILRGAPGIMVIDKHEDAGYATPLDCVGEFATFVSRIREDKTVENGLSLWVVSDNLRKGAALNAVQIAELMLNKGLFKRLRAA